MFLIVVDVYTKWPEIFPVNTATSDVIIEKPRLTFATHSLPEVMVTDNGTCFTSQGIKTFMRRSGIQYWMSAPYHPASNGLAERATQTLSKLGLAAKLDEVSVSLQDNNVDIACITETWCSNKVPDAAISLADWTTILRDRQTGGSAVESSATSGMAFLTTIGRSWTARIIGPQ